jgi:hypothetical protein
MKNTFCIEIRPKQIYYFLFFENTLLMSFESASIIAQAYSWFHFRFVTYKTILRFCWGFKWNSTALLNTFIAPKVEGFDIRSNVEDCLR